MEKLIITAAIRGAEVTKEQNLNIPYTVRLFIYLFKYSFKFAI